MAPNRIDHQPARAEHDPARRPGARRHTGPIADPWIEDLGMDECLTLLRGSEVGRVAMVVDGFPVVLPVNHRVMELEEGVWVALRTRPGNVIDNAPEHVAFQVDGFDAPRRQGWSVLVRGKLRRIDPEDLGDAPGELDPHAVAAIFALHDSWLQNRDSWIVIEAVEITGRRLHAAPHEWPFHPHAYI